MLTRPAKISMKLLGDTFHNESLITMSALLMLTVPPFSWGWKFVSIKALLWSDRSSSSHLIRVAIVSLPILAKSERLSRPIAIVSVAVILAHSTRPTESDPYENSRLLKLRSSTSSIDTFPISMPLVRAVRLSCREREVNVPFINIRCTR